MRTTPFSKSIWRTAPLILALTWQANAQQSDLITFEPDSSGYLPDGTLAQDNLLVSDQFLASNGVSFGYDQDFDLIADAGSSLILEDAANSNGTPGYWSTFGPTKYNSAAPGFEDQLGDWFLVQDRTIGVDRLLITYDNPVTAASGEIWDLDGNSNRGYEQWEITAYDSDLNLIGRLESPLGINESDSNSLDSKPWLWSFEFNNEGEEISTILMTYTGETNVVGPVAFNNFATSSPTNDLLNPETATGGIATPEPSFGLILGIFASIAFFIRSRCKAEATR